MDSDGLPRTLPDLLRDGLDVLFVGINPSIFSAEQGHYFARRANRFWPSFSRSTLSRVAREAMGVAQLTPAHDGTLLAHGFGFTDLVKRPTGRADELATSELIAGTAILAAKIKRYRPKVACVHGMMAYRQIRAAIMSDKSTLSLGLQPACIARTPLFVVPNPSPANAHFTPADQTRWYDELARYLARNDA
ncbi:MAG: mismatch-specific DNA-glycosylase [Alphaproteobacteria bacterium]